MWWLSIGRARISSIPSRLDSLVDLKPIEESWKATTLFFCVNMRMSYLLVGLVLVGFCMKYTGQIGFYELSKEQVCCAQDIKQRLTLHMT